MRRVVLISVLGLMQIVIDEKLTKISARDERVPPAHEVRANLEPLGGRVGGGIGHGKGAECGRDSAPEFQIAMTQLESVETSARKSQRAATESQRAQS